MKVVDFPSAATVPELLDAPPIGGPQATIPTLKPGLDRLPPTCSRCGSRLLAPSEPANGEHWDILSCVACGDIVAYLDRPLPSVTRRLVTPESRLRQQVQAWRLAGCTDVCRENAHDPDAHELFGRAMMLAELRDGSARLSGVIATGPLLVDLGARSAMVAGDLLVLTWTELEILLYLASRLDRACAAHAMVAAIWGHETARIQSVAPIDHKNYRCLRVPLSRLRTKLGPAGRLLVTVTHYGYRLKRDVVEES